MVWVRVAVNHVLIASRFESCHRYAVIRSLVAQLVERSAVNGDVVGSSPAEGAILLTLLHLWYSTTGAWYHEMVQVGHHVFFTITGLPALLFNGAAFP